MSLGGKAVLVALLAVLVIVLNLRARKRRYEQFREVHTRRKYRVPVPPADRPAPPASKETRP